MDRLLPWLRRSGWAYVVVAVALALVAWRVGGDGGGGGQPALAAGTATTTAPVALAAPDNGPAGLVHVAGAVSDPGVYEIGPGDRVVEVIKAAGGPTRRADLAALNLAATLEDGQQVLVPERAHPGAPASAGASATGTHVRLSTATPAELEELDGIGPTLASRIVEWRDAHGGFRSVDDLLDVPGIGPTRLESLRTKVVP